jgi:hypothetical protein
MRAIVTGSLAGSVLILILCFSDTLIADNAQPVNSITKSVIPSKMQFALGDTFTVVIQVEVKQALSSYLYIYDNYISSGMQIYNASYSLKGTVNKVELSWNSEVLTLYASITPSAAINITLSIICCESGIFYLPKAIMQVYSTSPYMLTTYESPVVGPFKITSGTELLVEELGKEIDRLSTDVDRLQLIIAIDRSGLLILLGLLTAIGSWTTLLITYKINKSLREKDKT